MRQSKRFWRALLFIFLLAALCGSFAFPLVSLPVNAAPRMQVATLTVVINEVAWAGTKQNPADEWIELYNTTDQPIDLTNWRLEASDGSPLIPLSGSISAKGYLLLERGSQNVTDQNGVVYSSERLDDDGETLLLLNDTSAVVDSANSNGGEWPAGNSSGNMPTMERIEPLVETDGLWRTFNDPNAIFAKDAGSNDIYGTPGSVNWSSTSTVTTIVSDTPEPSAVNSDVDITVTVSGVSPTPTGTVEITGADTNCTITLSSGTGSCKIRFNSIGAKTITATYSGDATHPPSSDTEPHQVTTVVSTTLITADSPDPSAVNTFVKVDVKVSGPSSMPTGSVSVTGADTNCTVTLKSGIGSCNVRFISVGTKTITATYSGDSIYPPSSDTESHQVLQVLPTVTRSPTPVRTPTRTPTPLPPPPLLVINEFVPRPGHDWNNDGIVNVEDEYIEILNHGVVDVNLSGYSLDDEVNLGSTPYRLPSHVLRPGERIVFYGSQTGLLLSDGGDGVRLLRPNGQLMDAYNYFVVGYPDQAFCRLPDNGGADDWNQNCFPTPGLQNSLSGNVPRPSTGGVEELYCPIADTLPEDFASAECDPYGNNIWRAEYWDRTGWYGKRYLPKSNGRWPVFAD